MLPASTGASRKPWQGRGTWGHQGSALLPSTSTGWNYRKHPLNSIPEINHAALHLPKWSKQERFLEVGMGKHGVRCRDGAGHPCL